MLGGLLLSLVPDFILFPWWR